MTAPRSPFERILSMVDRKKYFGRLVTDHAQVTCKFGDNTLMVFRPTSVTAEGNLEGTLKARLPTTVKSRSGVFFFYVGKDRYFVHSKIMRTPGGWRILNCTEFYRLNRRENYRVDIPPNVTIQFHVQAVGSQRCNVMARVTEFSSGGARIRWTGTPPLEKSSLLKGNLIWLRGKEIPIQAVVKHFIDEGDLCGIQFVALDSLQTARFRMLSIEIQQLVNFG